MPEIEPETEEVFEMKEFTKDSEIIYASSIVLATVAETDTKLMSREDAAIYHRMQCKALKLMEFSIGELYFEVFGDEAP